MTIKRKNSTADLQFPDKTYRTRGQVERETVQAMRDTQGDRREAAIKLGVSLNTLAKRLGIIRAKRAMLETHGG